MKQIARWAVLSMAAVAASAAIPAFADGDEPEATGTATVENDILTLSGLVTNVTAEADLGASVTQVVMTAEGGVAFGASVTAAKNYALDGTGIVSVAEGKQFSVTVPLLSTIGHTLVKDGPGTLYISSGAVGKVPTLTRWVVKEGELRIRAGGSFFGGHSNTTNLSVELREGTTYYQEQVNASTTHNPMGALEMTGAQFIYAPSTYSGTAVREGNAAFKGGVTVHASQTPSYMTWPRYSHLNHCNPDCVFNIEAGGKLIVDGVLTNGAEPCVLTKRGGGELVLLRRNGWTGGTVFEEGTITVSHPEALGKSTLTIAGDVTIHVPTGVTFVCPPLATDGTHTLTVTGGGVFTQPASVPEGLTIANNTAGNASPIMGNTLHLAGGTVTLNLASDTIITSTVDDGSGAGKYTDIVKTGAGTLTLPTGISASYRNLTVKEGLVSVAAESCFGWGETVVNGGGIRYTANITQTRTSRPITYQGSGTIDVPTGIAWKFMTNSFACANAVVTKTGAGTWQSYDPLKANISKYSPSRWIIHEGKLKCCSGDMFAGHASNHNLVIEVHEEGVMELYNAGHHLPVCSIVLRGGTLQGYYGQFMGTYGVEGGGRWKGWGLNGPITVLPSLNGQPSRIIARASHLHHGNDPQSTTFDVQDGATLEIDAALHPGIQQSSANPNLGSFVKTGGGTLKLLKPCGAKGTIDIRDGTVELAAGVRFDPQAKVSVSPRAKLVLGDKAQLANATDAASALCATADVWLDASRLSLADGATVSSVPNLGTAGGNFAKFTWTAGSWRIPDLPTYKANGINGKGVLNFNGVQALCLPTYTNKTENLQVFYVSQWTTWTPNGGMGKWGGPMSFGNRKMTGDDNGEYGVLTYQHWDGSSVVPMVTLTKGASPSVRTAAVGTPYLVSSYLTRTSIGSTVYVSDDVAPVSSSDTHPVTNVNVELVCVGGRTAVGGAAQVKSATPRRDAGVHPHAYGGRGGADSRVPEAQVVQLDGGRAGGDGEGAREHGADRGAGGRGGELRGERGDRDGRRELRPDEDGRRHAALRRRGDGRRGPRRGGGRTEAEGRRAAVARGRVDRRVRRLDDHARRGEPRDEPRQQGRGGRQLRAQRAALDRAVRADGEDGRGRHERQSRAGVRRQRGACAEQLHQLHVATQSVRLHGQAAHEVGAEPGGCHERGGARQVGEPVRARFGDGHGVGRKRKRRDPRLRRHGDVLSSRSRRYSL